MAYSYNKSIAELNILNQPSLIRKKIFHMFKGVIN